MIDDDKSTCFLERYLLTELDVSDEIVCIYNGEEALEYIQEGIKRQVYPDLAFSIIICQEQTDLSFWRV